MEKYRIGYLVGSLSSQSINRRLATALIRLAPADLEFFEIPIRDLPLYSQDYDRDLPEAAKAFQDRIASADGLLVVTPEYNRSIPGALKNAFDWGSRPPGQSSCKGQPTGLVGTSGSGIGSALGQQAVRVVLNYFGLPLLTKPEMYIQMKPDLIDDAGTVTVEGTRDFLARYMTDYLDFTARILAARRSGSAGG